MSKTRPGRAFTLLSVAALACALAACTEDTPCDEGQELQQGMCYPAADAAVPTGSDASASEEAEAGGPSPFDRTCATSAECVAPADYCSVPPGKCTATGCETNPAVCPATWQCLDLTPFGNPVHICVPPNL
jgi:hypothetical protein